MILATDDFRLLGYISNEALPKEFIEGDRPRLEIILATNSLGDEIKISCVELISQRIVLYNWPGGATPVYIATVFREVAEKFIECLEDKFTRAANQEIFHWSQYHGLNRKD